MLEPVGVNVEIITWSGGGQVEALVLMSTAHTKNRLQVEVPLRLPLLLLCFSDLQDGNNRGKSCNAIASP